MTGVQTCALPICLAAVREGLKKQKADDRTWLKAKGACVCNLRVARMGILADVREFAKTRPDGAKRFPHVLKTREFNAAAVPVPFDRPFTIPPAPGGKDPLVVVSAPRIAEELAELETTLRTEQTFRMKMVDFLDVTSDDLAKFDAKVGEVDEFWTKFGYVLLKRLADKSGESGFPILVA